MYSGSKGDNKDSKGGSVNRKTANINNDIGGVSINCVSFNQHPERSNYFITVDDASNFRLWDAKKM